MKFEEQEDAVQELQKQLDEAKGDAERNQKAKDETVRLLERCMDDVRKKTVSILTDESQRELLSEPVVFAGALFHLLCIFPVTKRCSFGRR